MKYRQFSNYQKRVEDKADPRELQTKRELENRQKDEKANQKRQGVTVEYTDVNVNDCISLKIRGTDTVQKIRCMCKQPWEFVHQESGGWIQFSCAKPIRFRDDEILYTKKKKNKKKSKKNKSKEKERMVSECENHIGEWFSQFEWAG